MAMTVELRRKKNLEFDQEMEIITHSLKKCWATIKNHE